MGNSVRLIAVAVLIAATQAGVYLIDRGWTPASAILPDYDPAKWPLTLGDWQGQYVEVAQTGGANVNGNWLYRNPTGDQISLLVGVWKDYTVVLPHTPAYCYPAAGWKETSHKDVEVPVEGRGPLNVRLAFMERETDRIAVLYWYQFGDEILLEHEQLRGMQQRIRGHVTHLPPAIKVMLQTGAFDPNMAERLLVDFATLVAAQTLKFH